MQIKNNPLLKPATLDAIDRQRLTESAQDFESLFYEIVLNTMRQSISKSGLVDGGNAEDIYRSMLDGEYAKVMAKQNNSPLAQTIEKQLLEKMGIQQDSADSQMFLKGMKAYKDKVLP